VAIDMDPSAAGQDGILSRPSLSRKRRSAKTQCYKVTHSRYIQSDAKERKIVEYRPINIGHSAIWG
jgi:hypothetical protein